MNSQKFVKVNSGFLLSCTKCLGTGYIEHYAYESEGLCFKCAGRGFARNAKVYATIADAEKHLAKLEKARMAREAKRDAQRAADFIASEPQRVAAELERQRLLDQIAHELASQEYLAGNIGDFVTFTGIVTASFSVKTGFGNSILTKVQAGNAIVKFFSTANFAYDLAEGQTIVLNGQIASFDIYEGNKETLVKKTKVVA